MRIKLFNGTTIALKLDVLAGGYDTEARVVTAIVTGESGQAGTITFDVAEAHRIAAVITNNIPTVSRIPGTLVDEHADGVETNAARKRA